MLEKLGGDLGDNKNRHWNFQRQDFRRLGVVTEALSMTIFWLSVVTESQIFCGEQMKHVNMVETSIDAENILIVNSNSGWQILLSRDDKVYEEETSYKG